MAFAIHKTASGETLNSIAASYFAVKHPGGAVDDVREKKIVRAIRRATPTSVTDLTSYADNADLGANKTIYVPTVRQIRRVLLSDVSGLQSALEAKGYEHSGKLLTRSLDSVLANMTGSGFTTAQITRVYVLTQFLNLDGMDLYSAKYLYDTASITSLVALSQQSTASMTTILTALTGSPHNRPSQLTQQDHARRWPTEARIYTRTPLSQRTIARRARHPIAVPPNDLAACAEHYEATSKRNDLGPGDRAVASHLGRVYRFSEATARGNQALHAGRWRAATNHYEQARREFHRLAEETGAVSSAINDAVGINCNTALDTVKRVLETLPTNEAAPLGAPEVRSIGRSRTRPFGLRSFRYSELETAGTDRKAELRTSLGSSSIHQLPAPQREGIKRASLSKTASQLSAADTGLLTGLTAGATTLLARDLAPLDQATFQRNVSAVAVSKTYSGGSNLDVFDTAAADLPLAGVSSLVGTLWSATTAGTVLSATAKAAYPSAFVNDTGLSPFAKFVILPGVQGATTHEYVKLDSSFVANIRDGWMKNRLKSSKGLDMRVADEVALDAGGLAFKSAWAYCVELPSGCSQAYAKSGDSEKARTRGAARTNVYNASGTLVSDVAGVDAALLDSQLTACVIDDAFPPESEIWQPIIIDADNLYKAGDLAGARTRYEEAACVLLNNDPTLADEARIGLGGVLGQVEANGDIAGLSTLKVAYSSGGTTGRVQQGSTIAWQPAQTGTTRVEAAEAGAQYFEFFLPPSAEPLLDQNLVAIDTDADFVGASEVGSGVVTNFTTEPGTLLFQDYLYVMSKIDAIDLALNWLGFRDDYLPPWSADHLYGVARDLCNRALECEARVVGMLQALEQAKQEEFLADQATFLADENLDVAMAQAETANAAAQLAVTQADLAQKQAELAASQNSTNATMGLLAGGAEMISGVFSLNPGKVIGGAITLAGAVGDHKRKDDFEAITDQASAALDEAEAVKSATAALGVAQVDVAELQVDQADAYLEFLEDQVLDSAGYEALLALARDTHERAQSDANRVTWLAERALAYQTRRALAIIAVDYGNGDEIYDMTRSQRLTADLEGMRASYVSGESVRRQRIRWDVALSQLAPGAVLQLRDTGECAFPLDQRMLDLAFPGLYLHSLQELELTVVGLIPPGGLTGTLQLSARSLVRVPNTVEYTSDGSVTLDDWTAAPLVLTPTGANADYTEYDDYIMKELIAAGADLSLSSFRVERDRAVLQAPQGMLDAVQHHGLDTIIRLVLPRTSNGFDFALISEVEFTFWFLAAYDDTLSGAQHEALWRWGATGQLNRSEAKQWPTSAPDEWTAFQAGATDAERLDLRTLVFDVPAAGPVELTRKLSNIFLAIAREFGSAALPVRLRCATDPVGVALSIGTSNVVYSAIGVSPAPTDPAPDSTLATWVTNTFYSGGPAVPTVDPTQRFVLKFSPGVAGSNWYATDEDGVTIATTSGPLKGTNNGGTAGTASYNGGSFLNALARVKIAHQGGTARLRLRGTSGYAVELSGSAVTLKKGSATLGSAVSLAYPSTEFVTLELRCWNTAGGSAVVEGWVDGIRVVMATDGTPTAAGTVLLEVTATAAGPVPVEFDDLEVVKLTGKGVEGNVLLFEPFTSTLPATWTFVNGSVAWSISGTGHKRLDLTSLTGLGLGIEFQYTIPQGD